MGNRDLRHRRRAQPGLEDKHWKTSTSSTRSSSYYKSRTNYYDDTYSSSSASSVSAASASNRDLVTSTFVDTTVIDIANDGTTYESTIRLTHELTMTATAEPVTTGTVNGPDGPLTVIIVLSTPAPTSTLSSTIPTSTTTTTSRYPGGLFNTSLTLNSTLLSPNLTTRSTTPFDASTAVLTSAIPTGTNATALNQTGADAAGATADHHALSRGAIAGVSVAATVALLALLLLALLGLRKRKSNEKDDALDDMMAPSSRADPYGHYGQDTVPGSTARYSDDMMR